MHRYEVSKTLRDEKTDEIITCCFGSALPAWLLACNTPPSASQSGSFAK